MAERTREQPVDDRVDSDRRSPDGVRDEEGVGDRRDPRRSQAAAGPAVVRERQRDEYGGFNLGAAFFGWLVAIGIAVLLTALLSAAGAAIGLSELSEGEARSSADTISIVGGALLLLVLAIAYYAGGYVAGRMSRFDGTKQGIGVWVIGLLVTIIAIGLGAIFGSQYNILDRVQLPRIPVSTDDLSMGGIITAIAVLVLTLLAAMAGGAIGHRYHNRVDRVAGI